MTESDADTGGASPDLAIRTLVYGAEDGHLRSALAENAPAGVVCRAGGMLDALDDLIEGRSAALVVVEAAPGEELVVDVATFMSVAPDKLELLVALDQADPMIGDELLVAGATAILTLPDDVPRLMKLLEDRSATAGPLPRSPNLIDVMQDDQDQTPGASRAIESLEALQVLEASFALPAVPPPRRVNHDSPTNVSASSEPGATFDAAFDRLHGESTPTADPMANEPTSGDEPGIGNQPDSQGNMAPADHEGNAAVVRGGKLVVVVGASQGVGATSVAITLACLGATHAAEDDLPVPVIVDLDPYYGDMMMHLGVPSGEGFLDLLRHAGRVDQNLLELVSHYEDPGFRVLACQAELDDDSVRLNDDVVRILFLLCEGGGLVVADLPRHDRVLMRKVLMQAHSLVIVFDATPKALRDAIRIEALALRVCSTIRVARVLSHSRTEEPLQDTDIVKVMGRKPDYELLHDHAAFRTCLETGKPLPVVASHAKPMRELTHLFGNVVLNERDKPRTESSWFSRLLHFGRVET